MSLDYLFCGAQIKFDPAAYPQGDCSITIYVDIDGKLYESMSKYYFTSDGTSLIMINP